MTKYVSILEDESESLILSDEEFADFSNWTIEKLVFVEKTKDEKLLGSIGLIFGALSFAFSGVLGYKFGEKASNYFGVSSSPGKEIIASLFSFSAYMPLAMLCAPHAKETFEYLYSTFKNKNPHLRKYPTEKVKAYVAGQIIVWTLGILAAADSTQLTHELFSPYLGEFVYPLDGITQIAMTILRAWSLNNFINIAYITGENLFNFYFPPKKVKHLTKARNDLTENLEKAIRIISMQDESALGDFYDFLSKEDQCIMNYFNIGEYKDFQQGEKEIKNNSYRVGKTIFSWIGSGIGALSINGFIPPAEDIGYILADFFDISDSGVRQSFANLFAASISICFGALTTYACHKTFGSFYDWGVSKAACLFNWGSEPAPKNNNKHHLKTLVIFIALLISAGSAIPATELALTYTDGQAKRLIFSVTAFIGLFATDYYPLEQFIDDKFNGQTKKGQLLAVCDRIREAIPRLSDKTILSIYQKNKKKFEEKPDQVLRHYAVQS